MSLKNILLRLSVRKIYMHILVFVFALCMISMGVLSGFAVLTVNADTLSDSYLTATPSSCSVGDTITLTVNNASSNTDLKYSYSYQINGGSWYSLTGFISNSVYYYTPVEYGTYTFRVSILSTSLTTVSSNFVEVISDESSDTESSDTESSDTESSDTESSDAESSFDPMNWIPSNWQGDDYVQPSADSTPDISFSLPSDFEMSVSVDMASIISSAFQALPSGIFALVIPTIIALFVGWWLHK